MLLSIQKRDVSSYQTFRQALIQNNQGHVVTRFLPEITDTQPLAVVITTQPKPESLKTQTEKKGKVSVNKFATKVTENILICIKSNNNSVAFDIQDTYKNIDICKDYFSNISLSKR